MKIVSEIESDGRIDMELCFTFRESTSRITVGIVRSRTKATELVY